MKKSMILLGMLSIGYAYAQSTDPYEGKVGINTTEPKATLDITPEVSNLTGTTNEGIIAPRLSKTRIANIEASKLTEGTLVYATDNATSPISAYTGNDVKVSKITEKGYYFYNGTEWVKVQYKDTNDAEWVYDDTTKRINLKRSGTSPFVNAVYYDNNNGNYINSDRATFPELEGSNYVEKDYFNKSRFSILGTSSKLTSYTANRRQHKINFSNRLLIDDTATSLNSRFFGSESRIMIDANQTGDVYSVLGSNGIIESAATSGVKQFLWGTNGTVAVRSGNISQNKGGYTAGVRGESYWNSTGTAYEITGGVFMTALGTSAGRVDANKGVFARPAINGGAANIGNSYGVSAEQVIGTDFTGTIQNLYGYHYSLVGTNNLSNVVNNYGIYLTNIDGATNNYAVYTNAGKVRVGDLADTSATADRVVTVDANGVLKTGGSIASNNGVQNEIGMTCTAVNAGKINYTTIQKDGKDVGVFGFCMQKGTDYVWAYMLGGSNIYGTSANGAAFGQGL